MQTESCEICGKPALSGKKRFCSQYCSHLGKRGQTLPTKGVAKVSLSERFWSKVDKRTDNECWLWTGATYVQGYGYLAGTRGEKQFKAHRLSYELNKGRIPEGMDVCHECDNPPCVNPTHLWLGTRGDNNRDRSNKGRGRENRQWGADNPRAKITIKEVNEIREMVARGVSQTAVAAEFDIKQPQVSRIIRGIAWPN
jgi:ribosome-binding protein aMBF1 (putative translation factor)